MWYSRGNNNMAFRIPPITDVLAPVLGWVGARQNIIWYALVLLGIWGATVYGWFSLGERALLQRMPPIQQAVKTYAIASNQALSNSIAILQPLAADPRIAQGLMSDDGAQSLDVRRAMYEFSYLNHATNLYVWSEADNQWAKLASAPELPPDISDWVVGLRTSVAAYPAGLPDNPKLWVALKLAGEAKGYVVLPMGLGGVVSVLPRPPDMPDYKGLRFTWVLEENGNTWQVPIRGSGGPRSFTALASRFLDTPRVQPLADGSAVVTAPVVGFAGITVVAQLPTGAVMGSGATAQWIVVASAVMATLMLLWRPSLPVRRKVAASLAPVVRVIEPLTSPIFIAARAVVDGKPQPPTYYGDDDDDAVGAAAPLKPGQFTADALAPKRPKASSSTKSKRPANKGTYVGALSETSVEDIVQKSTAESKPKVSPADQALVGLIDESLKLKRTVLHFQPVYRTGDGTPVMHEVLLRLIDREGQPIMPHTFIPVCRTQDWMERLDTHVLDKVLETQFAGNIVPATPLAINVAGETFDNLRYLEKVMGRPEILSYLVFELRSQELVKDQHAMGFLSNAREMGVKISVDYFGGGAAMVQASKKIGIDYIKMDAARFGTDADAKKELITLCRAAQSVELPVILEKIEVVAMEVFARRVGVSFLQGYLLGKPKPELVSGPLPGWRAMNEEEKPANAAATPDEHPSPDGPPPAAQG